MQGDGSANDHELKAILIIARTLAYSLAVTVIVLLGARVAHHRWWDCVCYAGDAFIVTVATLGMLVTMYNEAAKSK